MSGSEQPPIQNVPAEPRLSTLRLVRAIGARLRAPIDVEQRDALVAVLADASAGDELAARRRAPRGVLQRRFAVAAAALVVIGGAVGVAVRSTDDLPVIVIASGAPGTGSVALDSGARGGPEMMRADASPMIGLWVPTTYTFVLGDGVTVNVDRAPAWRMVPPADLVASATQLASTLGLPAPSPAEWDASALTAQDAGGANLWVSAGGDWYYGGPSDLWPMWDCPDVPFDGDAGSAGDGVLERETPVECTPPAPPSGVPSADRARTLALEHLVRLGVGEVRILDVYGDEWGASVQAELVIAGSSLSSGLFVGVGFAGEERLAWANGTLARPERLGDYPLLGLAGALERLEQEMNAWLEDGVFPMPRPLPADITGDGDAPVSDGDALEGERDMPAEDGDSPVSILPVPEPGPDGSLDGGSWEDQEPVERTVRIVAVELVMSVVWSPGDVQVLLPHYRLIDEDGGWWFVIALEDRHLDR
jgi:hypothetical protein